MSAPWAQADLPPWAEHDEDITSAIGGDSWRIDSHGEAERALAKLALTEADIDDVARLYDRWHDRLADWHDGAMAPLRSRQAFFEGALGDYIRRLREENPNVKSLLLPSGRVFTRFVPEKVVVEDQQAVLAWLHTLPEGREVIAESVRVSELRRIVAAADGKAVEKSTGEVVAGLAVEPESLSISVKPARETGPA